MFFMRLALLVGLTTIGQALLLPPSIPSADIDIINTLPFEAKPQADSRTLNLECSHCPIATWQPSGVVWVDGIESKLQLDFTISYGEVDALQLNGVQIYPPHDIPLEPLAALQITADAKDINFPGYLRLGYELGFTPILKSEQDQLELILMRLQIVEIGDKFVDGLDSVELKLLKTPTGKLMIGDLNTAPTTNPGGKDCNTLVCKFRKTLTSKLSHSKPTKGCGSKPDSRKAFPAAWQPTHDHGGHQHGHQRHHKHHGFSRLVHALKNVALHILIPVFIGVAVGFIASLIGMFVGQSIVFCWRTFYRRGQKGACSGVQQETTDIKKTEQGESLLGHQDPPPVYEDAVVDKQ